MTKKVMVAVADGCEEIETMAVIDILLRAELDVTSVSIMSDKQVTLAHGVKIIADKLLKDVSDVTFECVVLPGGLTGAKHFAACSELIDLLKKQKTEGRYYAALCASPAVVFSPHGLMEGEKGCCYPALEAQMTNLVKGQRTCVSNKCVTGTGPGSAMEFGLKLTEVLCGKEKADKLQEALLVKIPA